MKFAHLIRRNLFRNKMRSLLTMLLMAAIFFFVATLLSILENFDRASEMGEGYNRLAVQSAISLANMLPYASEAKIRELPGVEDTCKMQWIGAYYKDRKNFFANFALDEKKFATVFSEYKVPPKELDDFLNDRRGALVGPELMERFNWKIGDRITLTRTIFPFDPELTIRGVYQHPINTSALYFHMDYFQESIGNPSAADMIWIKVKDANQMAALSQQIDAMFKNTPEPTETFTEKEFQRSFMAMMGNIKLLFTAVSTCAVFMVILLAAITMSMSARERIVEISVLKAIGFESSLVLRLMLIEFALLTVIGGTAGVLTGRFLFDNVINMAKKTQGFLINFTLYPRAMAICVALAAAVGIIAGAIPAMQATRIRVVDGLRRVV
jgi:putative ABC transport system permease protein